MSNFRLLVGLTSFISFLQRCHFSAIGPAGARPSSAGFAPERMRYNLPLRFQLKRPGPERKASEAHGDDDGENETQKLDERRVFGMVEPQRLERALKPVQEVIAQHEASHDVDHEGDRIVQNEDGL